MLIKEKSSINLINHKILDVNSNNVKKKSKSYSSKLKLNAANHVSPSLPKRASLRSNSLKSKPKDAIASLQSAKKVNSNEVKKVF